MRIRPLNESATMTTTTVPHHAPTVLYGRRHPRLAADLIGRSRYRSHDRAIHRARDLDRRIRHFERARPDLHTRNVLTRLRAIRSMYRSIAAYH